MSDDLHLTGEAERTRKGYIRAVRQLSDFAQCSPAETTEQDARRFFLYLKNDLGFAYGSLRVALSGVKFSYNYTCKRDWAIFEMLKLQNITALPEVLTIDQVHAIVRATTTLRRPICSCGNRHCPNCGHEKTQVWIEKQSAKLMPVHNFLVTFTVPREIGSVLRGSQREGYRCLFDASSQSIRDVGSATKSLKGCNLGFFGVLHTWGRDPAIYHPHIHYVVPGETFVENFLQHVLPTNFMKIRHHGWMSANSKISLSEVKWLVWTMLGWTFWLASGHAPQPEKLTAAMKCIECGGEMRVTEVTYRSLGSLGVRAEHGLTYYDSG